MTVSNIRDARRRSTSSPLAILLAIPAVLVIVAALVVLGGLVTLFGWNVGVVGIAAALGANISTINLWTAIGAGVALGVIGRSFQSTGGTTVNNKA